DHRDGAINGIEIKNGGTPIAIYDMPVDVDALDRWEESRENRTHRCCPLNWGPKRSRKLDIFVKWRSTNIPCSKPIQVRFNSTNNVVPHEEAPMLEVGSAGTQSRIGASRHRFYMGNRDNLRGCPLFPLSPIFAGLLHYLRASVSGFRRGE